MGNTQRLVQILDSKGNARKVALVIEPKLILINNFSTAFDLVSRAIKSEVSLTQLIDSHISSSTLDYDEVYEGKSGWKILPSFDHPYDPNNCMITGTGLTHKASAESRQKMHELLEKDELTDSMKMYKWGLVGGRPTEGSIGVQPEWFYKGNGDQLKGHGDNLQIPPYADDGGEEPEIVGIYYNDPEGNPWRVGISTGNEFSDHIMEKKNYLYLAPSKIRDCAIGPELVINPDLKNIKGRVSIYRNMNILWQKPIRTGEDNMAHSIDNLEYHHFKYKSHRLPGQVHIHFFGADSISFADGIRLKDNDVMEVQWQKMGRSLRNPVKMITSQEQTLKINRCY